MLPGRMGRIIIAKLVCQTVSSPILVAIIIIIGPIHAAWAEFAIALISRAFMRYTRGRSARDNTSWLGNRRSPMVIKGLYNEARSVFETRVGIEYREIFHILTRNPSQLRAQRPKTLAEWYKVFPNEPS